MENNRLKAFILGDYSNPAYHPLKENDLILTELLSENFDLVCTEDRSMLEPHNISGFQLIISYVDTWEQKLDEIQLSGLLSFIALGGGFLAIHNGISYQNNPEYAQLIGAKFTGHPPYQNLQYKIIDSDHPITKGLNDFEMDEELYMFEFDSFSNIKTLIHCGNSESSSPAAWVRQYGQGRMVYLAPGHDTKSFKNEAFQNLIKSSALWAIKGDGYKK